MVSSNRRRLSRASAVSTAPLSISQEAPSTDAVVEIVADTMDASTTGDSDSANPPSLPDLHVAAADAAAPPSIRSNHFQNLALGVGGGDPLQKILQPSSAPSGALPADLAISQAGEVSIEHQQLPQRVDGVPLEPALSPPAPSPPSSTMISATSATTATTAIAAIAATDITPAPVIVRDALSALPVLPVQFCLQTRCKPIPCCSLQTAML